MEAAALDIPALIAALNAKTLLLTVTSGRSGTALLTALLRGCLGIVAEHEPPPRVNFVLRSLVLAPEMAAAWLAHEKLPAMLARATGPVYAETSHLFCKGLIEPMLDLGLRPRFIILTRPAPEVARSLFQMNVIPERTGAGRLALLGPRDPGVLPVADPDGLTDYQLCYWYAREIERRQAAYASLFAARGLAAFRIGMHELTRWDRFLLLATSVAGPALVPDKAAFHAVTARHQNPRAVASGGAPDRPLPLDIETQEAAADAAIQKAAVHPPQGLCCEADQTTGRK